MGNDRHRLDLAAGERAGARYRLQLPRDTLHGATGPRLGRLDGAAVDFKGHRDYQPGDDLRAIDWNVYARSDRLTIKVRHDEVTPHLDIVLDTSPSMDLAASAKPRALWGLAALFAAAADNAGCAHAAWAADDGGYRPLPNGREPPTRWLPPPFSAAGCPSAALRRPPPAWRPRGVRVLLSDLLWLDEPLRVLRPLAAQASRLIVVQLLASDDIHPSWSGNQRLLDAESGETLDIAMDDTAKRQHRARLAGHQQQWSRACTLVGAALTTLVAEEVVASWRLNALEALDVLGAC